MFVTTTTDSEFMFSFKEIAFAYNYAKSNFLRQLVCNGFVKQKFQVCSAVNSKNADENFFSIFTKHLRIWRMIDVKKCHCTNRTGHTENLNTKKCFPISLAAFVQNSIYAGFLRAVIF